MGQAHAARSVLILGRPNTGKTLFGINFAAWLGVRALDIQFRPPSGEPRRFTYRVDEARAALCGPRPNQTQGLQSISVSLPARKGKRPGVLVDSCGLTDEVQADPNLRRAMAQALRAMRHATVILHLVDAAAVGRGEAAHHNPVDHGPAAAHDSGPAGLVRGLGELDLQLARYGRFRPGYAVVANKMDLPEAEVGLARLRRTLPDTVILPVSALRQTGFSEVRRFVRQHV